MDVNSYLSAAAEDDGSGVALHLTSGFPPDLQIPDGAGGRLSILHLVASQGMASSTEALLVGGADPDVLDSHGEPPMKMAIAGGHVRVVQLLLDHGASVELRLLGGDTFLHVAYMSKQPAIAELLLERGANPDVPNDRGITARQVAAHQAMKGGGWTPSMPSTGAAFHDNLRAMSEEGLLGLFRILPAMVEARLRSGEITPARKAKLDAVLEAFEEAMELPPEIRSTRMREVADQLHGIMDGA